MCNMRGSRMTSSRVPHVPRDDYWGRATRKGKHWISSVLCYALLDYIHSFWFCFWTFNATERRFSSFVWIPRTLFVRSQIMSRNSEMTWISHEHNLSYTVSRQLGRARGRHVSCITLHADKLSQVITLGRCSIGAIVWNIVWNGTLSGLVVRPSMDAWRSN